MYHYQHAADLLHSCAGCGQWHEVIWLWPWLEDLAMAQNLGTLVHPNLAGKWIFIPPSLGPYNASWLLGEMGLGTGMADEALQGGCV
eukprot:s3664_g7.t1